MRARKRADLLHVMALLWGRAADRRRQRRILLDVAVVFVHVQVVRRPLPAAGPERWLAAAAWTLGPRRRRVQQRYEQVHRCTRVETPRSHGIFMMCFV